MSFDQYPKKKKRQPADKAKRGTFGSPVGKQSTSDTEHLGAIVSTLVGLGLVGLIVVLAGLMIMEAASSPQEKTLTAYRYRAEQLRLPVVYPADWEITKYSFEVKTDHEPLVIDFMRNARQLAA